MKTFLTAQPRIPLVYSALIILSQLFSCQKPLSDERGVMLPSTSVDLSTKVTTSVSGFVTDENDAAIQAANVSVGTKLVTTDEYGYFEVKNEPVVQNAATVSVSVAGYFPGARTYIAAQNKSAFVRIKLIPKTSAGTISSTAGGSVTLLSGLQVSLPANAVVNIATGTVYNGAVDVAASWLNPSATDLDRIMPGDLRALDAAGNFKQLVTYGMAAIELRGSGGEKLQIAAGKKASITFPILPSQSATAPASIALWYFDETAGLWKEEGKAIKAGNFYEAEVSHFSFWNCDVPENFVQINMTIQDQNGKPLSFSHVKITRMDKSNTATYGYTDSSGYVGGAIPSNSQLMLEVLNGYNCPNAVFTKTFTSSASNISFGMITVNTSQGAAVLSGTATNCTNMPLTDGFIIMKKGNEYSRHTLSKTGSFQFSTLLCDNTGASIDLIAEDIAAGQQGSPSTRSILAGNNAIGNLQACGIITEQFLNITINGTSYNFTTPGDSLMLWQMDPNYYVGVSRITPARNTVDFKWMAQGSGVGTNQPLTGFGTDLINEQTTIGAPINVKITEFGTAGEFLSGNFTGTFVGTAPTNTNYNVSCSFRIRRY